MSVSSSDFGNLLEPGLKVVYGDDYRQHPEVYSKIFETLPSTKAFEETLSISATGQVPEKPQGSSILFVNPKQNWLHRLTHVTYGLGYIVTRELYEDDQYNKIKSYTKSLAKSVRDTIETLAANILNRAFNSSYTGGDGLELCSTVHLLGQGGTYANELSTPADLTATSLEQALIDIGDMEDDAGLLMNANPKKLIVPKELSWTASKLLKSTLDPESANNSVNPAHNIMPYVVWNFLTDPDAWFILTDVSEGLKFYWRRYPEYTQDNESTTENAMFKTTFRCIAGWDDPRQIFGSPGA